MKLLVVGIAVLCFQPTLEAEVIVSRNGVDGWFTWNPPIRDCWPRSQTWLDISLPMNQTGIRSGRTLEWVRPCFYYFGCEGYHLASLRASGSDVEIAGGDTFTFLYSPCYTQMVTTSTPRRNYYNAIIDQNMQWQSGPLSIALIGPGVSDIAGLFVGIRVRLTDGWHYGWVMLQSYSGERQPGTIYGEFRPGAYALESQPNTPVTTPPCRLDLNFDGVIDFEDYLTFVNYFVHGDQRARWSPYAPGDYEVDFFDYLDFVSEFSTGC